MFLERIPGWFRGYFNYKDLPGFLGKEKAKGGLVEAVFLYVIIATLALITSFLYLQAMGSATFSQVFGSSGGLQAAVPDFSPLGITFQYVSGMAEFFLLSAFLFGAARFLGGNGSFKGQTYLLAVTAFVFSVISFPVMSFVFFLPVELVCILYIPLLLLSLYSFYVLYQMIKAVHTLTRWTAIAVLVVYVIATYILSALSLIAKMALGV